LSRASGLFARYWFALAAVATLPILAAGAIEGWVIYQSEVRAATERQVLEARQAAYLIERSVLPPADRLRRIAALPWDYPTATPAEWQAEMRRLTSQHPLIARVVRLGPDGSQLASYPEGARPELSPARAREVVERSPATTSGVPPVASLPGEAAGTWSFVVTERGTGNRIVADLSIEVVNELLRAAAGTRDRLIFVADAAQSILAHPDARERLPGTPLASIPGWSSVAEPSRAFERGAALEGSLGDVSLAISSDPRHGRDWFAAWHRIPELDWTVVALAPSAGVRAQLWNAVARTALILLAANAVALLLALWLARRLSRPLESLALTSRRVADGDLTVRADVERDDDLGQLARQFNVMVAELEGSYAELERKVAEKTSALELANRHKSEFLAQMSHELRTPLNAIIGYAYALKAEYFGPLNPKQREYADQVHVSGQHLLALINDLLDLAKIEAGRMDLELASIELPPLVDAALAMVRVRAQEKGIELSHRVGSGALHAVADERKLKQILVNLLSNAVKFTPEGGAVEIAVEELGPREGRPVSAVPEPGTRAARFVPVDEAARGQAPSGLLFRVCDTGVGISAERRAKLFTDFAQFRVTADREAEGTGLGLALSQRLAELHGTQIHVDSIEGRGATFWFVLPAKPWPAS
jgi:signal transduction histidine kinase